MLVGALIPGTVGPSAPPHPGDGPPVRVGLAQGSIHTDFLLPLTPETRTDFAFADPPADADWLAVGWGAAEFYTTVGGILDVEPRILWRAITGDGAVIRTQPIGPAVPAMIVTLSTADYTRLRAVILDDLTSRRPVATDLLAPCDRYFPARGQFTILNTCNQWIARTLRRADQPFGIWTPAIWSVRLSHAAHLPG